ncbi:hypothetical protein pdam_00013497 [Pocillopora damicornis]|uniref:Uncharacterized protein n=1 Tax=Pocillopora damicornis TaxID=46731 RepID=A0A3M6TJB8_POCDA|nr:hypothetical protein pdam_00013497 [Pocillopora damicornis]
MNLFFQGLHWLTMAVHLIGVSFNLRFLLSCFKDKQRNIFLEKCRPIMVFQCVLQLTVLAMNANRTGKMFNYFDAMTDHTIIGLNREPSSEEAIPVLLIAGVVTLEIGLYLTLEQLILHGASSLAGKKMRFKAENALFMFSLNSTCNSAVPPERTSHGDLSYDTIGTKLEI